MNVNVFATYVLQIDFDLYGYKVWVQQYTGYRSRLDPLQVFACPHSTSRELRTLVIGRYEYEYHRSMRLNAKGIITSAVLYVQNTTLLGPWCNILRKYTGWYETAVKNLLFRLGRLAACCDVAFLAEHTSSRSCFKFYRWGE